MKPLKTFSLLIVTFLLALPILAQTNNPPAPPINPFTPILNGTIDTNNTLFAHESFQLRIGTEQLGVDASGGYGATLGVSYHLTSIVNLEGKFVNANVAGTLLNSDIGIGISKSYANFQFTGYLLGGYNWDISAGEADSGLRIGYFPSANNRLGLYTEVGLKINSKSTRSKSAPSNYIGLGVIYSF